MIKRKKLGQHFLNSNTVAKSIVFEAKITENDTVFEIGTGLGILIPLLCKNAKNVISVDADKELYQNAKSQFENIKNLSLKLGDGFKMRDTFTIFVSNLPYSKSKIAIEWLAQRQFSHGVIMVQKEFADKLLEKSFKKRRAVNIIANHTLELQKISIVKKNNFIPPPKIDSVILKIIKKRSIDNKLIETVNKIFSYRRKTVQNILKQFNKENTSNKRLDDLSVDEIINIAKEILL
ncbi:MAG: rRNA adenine N(6)-methyltransferase family protein [Nitrosopumilus sp.]|nr:rRNA adenine N(6)-methyltransferase family protein [Nitrosopumilus sp.]MDH3501935.1 rRNA adenine N(6)-methyltransferase family protein [Nitrosopumilus sp.]